MQHSYRTALVTGASSGIGRALALELARAGTRVILAARRRDALDTVAAECATPAEVLVLDVRDGDATVAAIAAADERAGGLDLVIANAGVGVVERAAPSWSWGALAGPCHTNFCGAAATLTAALPAMVARGRGRIAGISSLAAYGALPAAAAYCAPKAGLDMLLACLRLDLAATGVGVTTVHLGFVKTPITAESTHPMPQLMDPDDAARRIVRGLVHGADEIALPQPLAFLTKLTASVPGRRWLLERFR